MTLRKLKIIFILKLDQDNVICYKYYLLMTLKLYQIKLDYKQESLVNLRGIKEALRGKKIKL